MPFTDDPNRSFRGAGTIADRNAVATPLAGDSFDVVESDTGPTYGGTHHVYTGTLWAADSDGHQIGTVHKFHHDVPGGGIIFRDFFLKCDGSSVSRTTYAMLFAQIGVTAGSGDGSTTFNLPDHRGKHGIGVTSGGHPSAALGAKSSNDATGSRLDDPIDHSHDAHDDHDTHAGHDPHGPHATHGPHSAHPGHGTHPHNLAAANTSSPTSTKLVGSGTASTVADGTHHHSGTTDGGQMASANDLHGVHTQHTEHGANDHGDHTRSHDSLAGSGKGHRQHLAGNAGKHAGNHSPWIAVHYAIRAL